MKENKHAKKTNKAAQHQYTLGIIGVGTMGEAIIKGMKRNLGNKTPQIIGTTHSAKTAAEISQAQQIKCQAQNTWLAQNSDVIILSVKPHQAQQVLAEIKPFLNKKQLLISICAGITLSQIRTWTGEAINIMRAMPNTPCIIGEGITALSIAPEVTEGNMEIARSIFSTVGKVVEVAESLFDGVTGLSACGPAYIFLIIEALSEAGVKVGLSRSTATLLATQTMLGSSKMVLERGVHPASKLFAQSSPKTIR